MKYRVEYTEGSGHGDLYELEQDQFHRVIEIATGRTVLEFRGEYCASYDGSTWSNGYFTGVVKVELSEDERYARVYSAGIEQPEIVAIPD